MTPFGRRKKENVTILEEIYTTNTKPAVFSKLFKDYFSDPKRVEILLSRAIILVGLVAIGVGFFQIRSQLGKYFLPITNQSVVKADINANDDLLGLQKKDTDSDGLSDYNELYIYSTSPYLKDTDSDGIDDNKEITSGTNPNCPQGKLCAGTADSGSSATANTQSGSLTTATSQAQAKQIRQALLQSGMTASDLDQLTDQQILDTYNQVAAENPQLTGAGSSGLSQSGLTASSVENMTPTEIRALLIKTGMSEGILNQISDQDLMSLVKDTLSSSQSSTNNQ
ncbi:MAG: hypothetical protein WC508_02200 [Patescibacteria group bacterium]